MSLSQRDLPSVPLEGVAQEGENLRDKVFNYVPGTVNTRRGAAVCMTLQTSHTPFRSTSDSGTGLTSLIWSRMLLSQAFHQSHRQLFQPNIPARSSTPYRGTTQGPMNRTFDISNISPTNFGAAQDAGHDSS